jgi:hypothetical protein
VKWNGLFDLVQDALAVLLVLSVADVDLDLVPAEKIQNPGKETNQLLHLILLKVFVKVICPRK